MDNTVTKQLDSIIETYKKYNGLNIIFDPDAIVFLAFSYKTNFDKIKPFMDSLHLNLIKIKQRNINIYVNIYSIENLIKRLNFFDIIQNNELYVEEIMTLLSDSTNIQFDDYVEGYNDIKFKGTIHKTIYVGDTKGIFDFGEILDGLVKYFYSET